MTWLPFAILASVCFGFYNLFTRFAATTLSPTLALMLLAGTSFIVASVATLVLKFSGAEVTFSTQGIWFPVLAGLATGLAEIFYLLMFTRGGTLSAGTPFVLVATSCIASLLGLVFLHESISVVKAIGFALSVIGLILLSIA